MSANRSRRAGDSGGATPRAGAPPAGSSAGSDAGAKLLATVDAGLTWAPLVVSLVYLAVCPYTKVEESFNMQAAHDMLFHGTNIEAYDHHMFPGVVPRTFIGAGLLAAMAAPVSMVARALGLSKMASQLAVRAALATLVWLGFLRFRRAFGSASRFGSVAARVLTLLTVSQFHLLFYASRTLPNTFAVALVLFAAAAWLEGDWHRCVVLFVMATVWFRCDTLVLFGPVLLTMLATRLVRFWQLVGWGLVCGAVCLAATVVVDSWFWQRWLWPEGEVLWFNTILNKSHQWGTQPWHWYFTSALPRALLGAALALPAGLLTRSHPWPSWAPLGLGLDRRAASLAVPTLAFVALYSWLPHKELRFVLPAVTLLNAVAAHGVAKLWVWARGDGKAARDGHRAGGGGGGTVRAVAALALGGMVLANTAASAVLLAVSARNYPGGEALAWLHAHGGARGGLVHIDPQAAMTGITRFSEAGDPWRYSKDESLSSTEPDAFTRFGADGAGFDYLLTPDAEAHTAAFDIAHTQHGMPRIDLRGRRIATQPHTYVLRRRRRKEAST